MAVSGVPVSLFSPGGGYLGIQAKTGPSGTADFELPAREYTFRADYQGRQFWSDVVKVGESGALEVRLSVAP